MTFLIVTFAFMPKALLGQGLYAPMDILGLASPYRDALASTPHVAEVIQNDGVQSLPVLEALVSALRHGHWLMWSPYVAGGEPVGSLVTNGFQSPFNLLLVFLPTLWGLAAVTALRLLFSQAFFYLFLRRLRISSPVATFGAVAYTFCGTNVALLGRINAYLVLPAMLWATVRVLRRRRPGDVALLAVASALAWLAGFPGGFVNAVAIDALFAVFLAFSPVLGPTSARGQLHRMISGLALVACGFALCVGVVAVSLLPSDRILTDSGLVQARTYTSADHLATVTLPSALSVGALGSLHNPGLFNTRQPDGTVTPAGNSVELESGAGMVVVIAALAGMLLALGGRITLTRPQRAAYLFGLLSVVGGLVLTYFDTPLLGLFYDLPVIGSSPANRFRIIIDIGFALIACLGIEGYRAGRAQRVADTAEAKLSTRESRAGTLDPSGSGMLVRVACAAALLAFVYLISRVWSGYVGWLGTPFGADVKRKLGFETGGAIALSLLVFGSVRWTATRQRYREVAFTVAGLLLAFATFATTGFPTRYFSPTVAKSWLLPRTAGHAELARLAGQRYRILGSGLGTFYSDTSIYYKFLDLRGLSISTRQFRALVQAAIPNAYLLDAFKVIYTPPSDPIKFASPVLDDLGVGYYVSGTNEVPFAANVRGVPSKSSRLVAPGLPVSRTISVDPRLTGVELPVQLGGGASCQGSLLRIAFFTPSGRLLAAATRPAIDAPIPNLAPAAFTIPVASLANHRRARVEVSVVRAGPAIPPPCRVAVGLTRTGQLDLSRLVQRPGQMPIVGNEQAVFYRRPHAHSIVWATGRWRAAATPDQALKLATSPTRRETDPVPVSGAGAPSHSTGNTVQRVSYVSNGFDVRSRTTGSALIATGFAGGSSDWSVQIDGRPARLASVDGGLLGTVVGPGTHTESFRYEPPGLTEGAAISAISVLILVGMVIVDRRRRHGAAVTAAANR